MIWAANICPAAEQAVVAFLRSANLSWLPSESIYAGLSHGQQDNPDDLETVEALDEDQLAEIPGPTVDDLPTIDEFKKNPSCVVSCNSADPAGEWDIRGQCMIAHVHIELQSHCDDLSGEQHNDMAGELFDWMLQETAPDSLTTEDPPFTAHTVIYKTSARGRNGHNWVSTLDVDIPGIGIYLGE